MELEGFREAGDSAQIGIKSCVPGDIFNKISIEAVSAPRACHRALGQYAGMKILFGESRGARGITEAGNFAHIGIKSCVPGDIFNQYL